jgi:hypothetical protein
VQESKTNFKPSNDDKSSPSVVKQDYLIMRQPPQTPHELGEEIKPNIEAGSTALIELEAPSEDPLYDAHGFLVHGYDQSGSAYDFRPGAIMSPISNYSAQETLVPSPFQSYPMSLRPGYARSQGSSRSHHNGDAGFHSRPSPQSSPALEGPHSAYTTPFQSPDQVQPGNDEEEYFSSTATNSEHGVYRERSPSSGMGHYVSENRGYYAEQRSRRKSSGTTKQ